MLFVDVNGNDGAVLPLHNGPICANVGVTLAVISISIVVTAPHGSVGVNVYVVLPTVAVLIDDGLHVPANPLSDVNGNDGAVLPLPNGPICANVGITLAVISI